MTSAKERQRRAAVRARVAQQLAERQAAARRRRQRLVAVGSAGGLLLVVAVAFWAVNALTGDDPPLAAASTPTPTASPGATVPPAEPGECAWNEQPADDSVVDVGLPPEGEPREGTQLITIETNLGDIEVEMDLAAAPCIAASLTHLAGQDFFDGTYCHRMFPGMLQCGSPLATDESYPENELVGRAGPSYRFGNENLPTNQDPAYYPAGVVALANSGPDTNGSQFFIIYQDTDLDGPNYSVVGWVTGGLEVLDKVEDIGHDGAFEPSPGGGHPNEPVIIESLRVGDPTR